MIRMIDKATDKMLEVEVLAAVGIVPVSILLALFGALIWNWWLTIAGLAILVIVFLLVLLTSFIDFTMPEMLQRAELRRRLKEAEVAQDTESVEDLKLELKRQGSCGEIIGVPLVMAVFIMAFGVGTITCPIFELGRWIRERFFSRIM